MTPRDPTPLLCGALLAMALTACGVDAGHDGVQRDADHEAARDTAMDTAIDAAMQPQPAGATGQASRSEAPAMPAAPPPLDTRRLQPARIVDQTGAGQPMVVAELQIPEGWRTVGGVTWNEGTSCVTNRFQMGWTAMAPDSLTALELLPGFNWQVAGTEIQMNPCPVAPYRSTREFLEATVQRTRPGARVLDYQDQPEVARKAAQAAPAADPRFRIHHDAGRILIGYQKDGVEMRELLSAVVTFSNLQDNIVAGVTTIASNRAPSDRLDVELSQRIGDTIQVNPQWVQEISRRGMEAVRRIGNAQRASIDDWHNRQMAIINARGMADRHAIRMRTNQEVAGIYSAIAANTSATNDRIHASTIDTIYERNAYAGRDGTTVLSSIHGGDRVFQDNNQPNHAYSTHDPYHDPTDATELERIR